MCLMIKQMDLVLKAVEQTTNSADDKETAMSLIADIVARGCRQCDVVEPLPLAKAGKALAEVACAVRAP